jgi:hypothetical protein
MFLIVAAAIVSIVSLAITFFLTDRSHWRKFLLIVGIVAAALTGFQAITNRKRSNHLQQEVEKLHDQQNYLDVSKLNALGLNGIAKPPLVENTPLNDLIGPHVKIAAEFLGRLSPERNGRLWIGYINEREISVSLLL